MDAHLRDCSHTVMVQPALLQKQPEQNIKQEETKNVYYFICNCFNHWSVNASASGQLIQETIENKELYHISAPVRHRAYCSQRRVNLCRIVRSR